ncbi:hypothetical protein ACPCSP_30535 [Streptomyces cinereoruber]|uniref:hypothetical protein n=1 Tax=Streptomyces TaxID=1883 RepID=UPI000786F138|nr:MULTISPECIES: hypothetical protein [unclassified Streptomyces]AVI00134.1 hypothetical protein C5L38_34315 [Streptomyces sp. WAC00288]KYG51195.1 hypothetical protein AWI43_32725 [Streptomyces sp. WAC04657]
MQITAQSDTDMEILSEQIGRRLAALGADVTIDLYTDDELTGEPAVSLQVMREAASAQNSGGGDQWMGVVVNLGSGADLQHFARLAHRVIGSEAFLDDKLVFSTIENELQVWVDLPADVVEEIRTATLAAGATSLSYVP